VVLVWRRKKSAASDGAFAPGDADYASSGPLEPSVSWTVDPPARTAHGYITKVSIQVENAGAAENLAVLVKADVSLRGFHLFEAGQDPIEQPSSRRLRDGRELIVARGKIAGAYVSTVTTEEPASVEVEAVLNVPGWSSG
jgi:hypothetical protein